MVRNVLAPDGFGRRRADYFVAAPQRCSGIACVADASHPARRRSERRSSYFREGTLTMACIEARGLRKAFGTTVALGGIDLRVEEGRILGLIGPNGAGKTTALNAILGLIPYQGELKVLGRDPWSERDQLMRDVSFIADVAVLPRWMRVSQMLDYVAGVHPRFDRAKAEGFLGKTAIGRRSRVRELSKGMVAQLHLALVMAVDAKLLVLDEPTLGLDILYRKQFYDSLLNDYFDRSRTIVVTTHQVEEIQDVLTDLMFIDRGSIVLECSMEEFEARYLEVMVNPDHLAAARALKPIHERQVFGRSILLFDHADRDAIAALGDVHRPSIADLFVAVMGNPAGPAQGAAR
jgi:ABC-2 type transport system ATP-binding protein